MILSGQMLTATLALALAHAAKPEPFNADFFATCATVIPVLFLALAVQGRGVGHMLRVASEGPSEDVATILKDPARLFSRRPLLAAVYVIISAGVVGECVALLALYTRTGPAVRGVMVLTATVILLLAVVTGPFLDWSVAIAGPRTERRIRLKQAGAPGASQGQHEHDPGQPSQSSSEPQHTETG